MTDWREIVKIVRDKHLVNHISLEGLSLSSSPSITSPTLRAPFDSILSLSSGPSQPPPAPSGPSFTDVRHPLTFPQTTIMQLISSRSLPPTLVHSSYLLPLTSTKGLEETEEGEVRLFWFVPSRLDDAKLKGLARAAARWRREGEAWWGMGENGDDVKETGKWLVDHYGE